MLRTSKVISISLPPEIFTRLETIRKQTSKTRSQVIKDLIRKYEIDQAWNQLYSWGEKTAEKFNISTEKDILKIIND